MEIVARVMTIGATTAIDWVSSGFFNLDHWTGNESGDLLGWRTIEVISLVVNGLSSWVGGFIGMAFSIDYSVSNLPVRGVQARQ